jgi:uncharacterized membrane protein
MSLYQKNLDIFIAGAVGLLGGAAYVAHVPAAVQVVLGIALFFAPGYLWSEAILSQRMPAIERAMATAGMSLIFPILGGFLFFGLGIPLFRSAWVGLLVVLTLLGVVAAAVQRLRDEQPDPRAEHDPRSGPGPGQPAPRSKSPLLHAFIYGIAAVIGLGTVAFSVRSANEQATGGFTMMWLTGTPPYVLPAQATPATVTPALPTKASLGVTNHEGNPELYELVLHKKGKVAKTWKFTLANGQTWQQVIAYTTQQGYSMVADLYKMPDTKDVYRMVDNGQQTKNS